ncbi:hypothetical protein PHYPSEUDO_010572 [Phytophthora pseudosyringae]|uniref:Uncharacterized protein n=1 Tax=Phytophthora pseudosyringae TaxID=221518 RepID=A0A8T1VAM6_9STRA|nr:hypothetical protein PHYPSEUDO_010572 [Phytophthora pseudosyringae]
MTAIGREVQVDAFQPRRASPPQAFQVESARSLAQHNGLRSVRAPSGAICRQRTLGKEALARHLRERGRCRQHLLLIHRSDSGGSSAYFESVQVLLYVFTSK